MPDKITFTYHLNPPTDIHTQVPASAAVDMAYDAYDAKTIRAVQSRLNEVLTTWKDAIGDLEKSKEDPGVVAYGQGKASKMQGKEDSDEE